MGIRLKLDESLSVLVEGAEVTLPVQDIVDRWAAGIGKGKGGMAAVPDAAQPRRLLPAPGAALPGQGGVFGGITRGADGQLLALIVATDPRGILTGPLGADNKTIPGAQSMWDGMGNTKALAAEGSTVCQQLLELEIDGQRDFFLMSQADAHVLAAFVPSMFPEGWHYTSTTRGAYYVVVQYFQVGDQDSSVRYGHRPLRAVRTIPLDDLVI